MQLQQGLEGATLGSYDADLETLAVATKCAVGTARQVRLQDEDVSALLLVQLTHLLICRTMHALQVMCLGLCSIPVIF